MKKYWHDNEWFIFVLLAVAFIVAVVGNYLYHGGHLVW